VTSNRNDDLGLNAPWMHQDRPVPRAILQPINRFLQREIAGGILLIGAAVVALIWANSPWSHGYESFWETEIVVQLGPWHIAEHLRAWLNDLLMAFFFYVVGLEIKRELLVGELKDRRAAALPAIAALGGMIVPALIFFAFNTSAPASKGWGIPMATDIAFAVGVLSLFSKRIPPGLVLFLLALAIADDVGAIAVIAIFYTADLNLAAFGVAVAILALITVMLRLGIRAGFLYALLAFGAWLAMFESGVHATIAGVALGFITPAKPFQKPAAVSREAHRVAATTEELEEVEDERPHVGEWLTLAKLSRQAISPLSNNEDLLHPWTSYLILPMFALANAGVNISDATSSGIGNVTIGVALGLLVGKAVGIFSASWIAVKTGIGQLPRNVTWSYLFGAAIVGGIGFTVALFVTQLAFVREELLSQAKIGVLAGSLVASIAGLAWLGFATRKPVPTVPEPDEPLLATTAD